MLSLASLLNPAPPGPPVNRLPPSPASSPSSPAASLPDDSVLIDGPMMARPKIPKDTALIPKSRPKGAVNFYPHERLDEASLRLVRKFRVHPFGNIQDYSRHIPYNSGKKDFYEKTGRESFEVFHYDFKVPGDNAEYTVMWDYNVGLVRMTPFFKCCKYPKTTPAKMLNLNPGLKEITHSITGGSIMAQGYWMPYQCAKAVCATFCHNIAGALIPIFGPDFPSLCTPSEAPEYSRMIIDPAIVVQSTREAEHFRGLYSNPVTSASSLGGGDSVSPAARDRHLVFRSPYDDRPKPLPHPHSHSRPHHHHQPRHNHQHPRIRKTFLPGTGRDSPYATATDTDGSDMSPVAPPERSSVGARNERYNLYSPIPPSSSLRPTTSSSSGWTPANIVLPPPPPLPPRHHHRHHHQYDSPGPSPWLSAVPRFTTAAHLPPYPSPQLQPHHPQPQAQPHPWRGGKRSAEHVEASDYDYDGEQRGGSNSSSSEARRGRGESGGETRHPAAATTTMPTATGPSNAGATAANPNSSSDSSKPPGEPAAAAVPGADKNAALLLMNLSFGEPHGAKGKTREGAVASETNSPRDAAFFPRIKRMRANSM
ncbi:hypothetical protein AAE478_000463 [Parahypoxylon ruwenzoriense]